MSRFPLHSSTALLQRSLCVLFVTRWDSGETYLILDKSMSHLVDNLKADLEIRTSFPVTSISYNKTGAILRGPAGATLACRKVIITVPLAVLQRGKIQFNPALPADKTAAIERIRMGNAAKVGVGDYTLWCCEFCMTNCLMYMLRN